MCVCVCVCVYLIGNTREYLEVKVDLVGNDNAWDALSEFLEVDTCQTRPIKEQKRPTDTGVPGALATTLRGSCR